MPLLDWNLVTEFDYLPVGYSQTRDNVMYFRFDDPNQFSGTTVSFDLKFVLRDGETFVVTTDEISFSN